MLVRRLELKVINEKLKVVWPGSVYFDSKFFRDVLIIAPSNSAIALKVFNISDLETLAFFKGLDKLGGFQHGIKSARVQPGITTLHDLNF